MFPFKKQVKDVLEEITMAKDVALLRTLVMKVKETVTDPEMEEAMMVT